MSAVERDEHYWMGSLAMTVTQAINHPAREQYLRSALRLFLRDHPPGNELGDLLRQTLKEKP